MPQYRMQLHWDAHSNAEHYSWSLPDGTRLAAVDEAGRARSDEFLDPEEGFIASIASCHMLSFIAEAARDSYVADSYEDSPVGVLGRDNQGDLYMAQLVLHPKVTFSGDNQPSDEEVEKLHERAQRKCYLSNSVVTDIRVEPEY